jgi:NADP-dependent 3-hydroxy acid dehydrogenase YdfG
MTENKKLQGKVAAITGGTTGIGLAAAKLFVKEGAYLFITARRKKELDKTVEEIGSNVTGVQGDVARLADLDRLYDVSNFWWIAAEAKSDLELLGYPATSELHEPAHNKTVQRRFVGVEEQRSFEK